MCAMFKTVRFGVSNVIGPEKRLPDLRYNARMTESQRHASPFSFEYFGLNRLQPSNNGQSVFAIFGRLVSGTIHQNEPISVEALDGSEVRGIVSHFQETFSECVTLPFSFYHTVEADDEPFCVVIVTGTPCPEI